MASTTLCFEDMSEGDCEVAGPTDGEPVTTAWHDGATCADVGFTFECTDLEGQRGAWVDSAATCEEIGGSPVQ